MPAMIAGNPVNTIAAGAFAGNPYVMTILLPDTITTVEQGALGVGQSLVYDYTEAPEKDLSPDAAPGSAIGLPDGQGGLVTTDDAGNLIRVDSAGNEYVLEDGGLFERVLENGYVAAILDPNGQAVRIAEDGTVFYTRANGDSVSISPNGARSVTNEREGYSCEEFQTQDEGSESGTDNEGEASGWEEPEETPAADEEKNEAIAGEESASSQLPIVIAACVLAICAVCAVILVLRRKTAR